MARSVKSECGRRAGNGGGVSEGTGGWTDDSGGQMVVVAV